MRFFLQFRPSFFIQKVFFDYSKLQKKVTLEGVSKVHIRLLHVLFLFQATLMYFVHSHGHISSNLGRYPAYKPHNFESEMPVGAFFGIFSPKSTGKIEKIPVL